MEIQKILKISINNINKNNSKKIDMPLEIYKNGFLISNRLNFIIKIVAIHILFFIKKMNKR